MKPKFLPGTIVVVKGHGSAGVRRVKTLYPDIPGGRQLTSEVAGFTSWNVADLRRPKRKG